MALSQSAADDLLARCDRTGRVHPGAQRLRLQRRFPAALAASQLATHMLQRGVDIRIIQILLGHSSLRSTEIYTHLTEPLRDQLRTLLCQTTDGLFEGRRPSRG